MSTQFSMLGLMNASLIAQGYDDIVSENDGSDEWRLLSRKWPLVVEPEMEAGLYSFTKQQTFLATQITGKFGFDYGYLVPSAALHVRRLWIEDGESRWSPDWVQDGLHVHTDEEAGVWIEYLESADPSLWTASFSAGVQMKLEAVLLRFREAYSEAREMEGQAEAMFQQARTISSKSRTPQAPYQRGQLSRARFSHG
jgi:hypothetical protein